MAEFKDYGLICENVDTSYADKEMYWCVYTSDITSKNENGTNHYLYLPLNDGCKAADATIPPYSKMYMVVLSADFENSVSSNDADIAASITNSNGGTVYLSNFDTGTHNGNGSGTTSYTSLSYTDKNATLFRSEDASAGYIRDSYGGTGAYLQFYFKLYTLTKFNWVGRYRINYYYYKPRAIVTVNGGTGSGTYHYGSTYTITATVPDGYTFIGWSDGNTDITRSFTVDSSLITAYETAKTYTAIYKYKNIYVGNKQATVYVGNTPVKAVYIGNTKIYEQ